MSDSRSDELHIKAQKLADEAFHDFWTSVVECSEIFREMGPEKQGKVWISKVIEELYHEQNGLCALCGDSLVLGEHEVDHKIPFCYGGGSERANIQLAHPWCSSKSKQVDPYDLLHYLEDRYMNL